MEIYKGIEIVQEALWIKTEKALIISDVHLGLEENLHNKGVFVPKQQAKIIIDKLKSILKEVQPKKIIINGDLKHDFGKILKQEWQDITKLIKFLSNHCQELILIKGNHDNILGPIASKNEINVVKEYQIKDILITHGDKKVETKKDIKTIVIGHEHPAISLREKSKVEKFKCFLKGKLENKNLIVMPSLNPLSYGSEITTQSRFSPLLKDISNFEVFVISDKEVLNFGNVKKVTNKNDLSPG
jgi:uncharacterized protein